MKLTQYPQDGQLHIYCLRCRHESVQTKNQGGAPIHHCTHCDYVSQRALIIDPAVNWWVGPDGEYWHQNSGVFVRNSRNQFLFFERTRFPAGLTVPAGHVDRSEAPLPAAMRELAEETGLRLPRRALKHVVTDSIRGDECRRGSDAHLWHVFVARMPTSAAVKVSPDEGVAPVWLSLNQASRRATPFAIRTIIWQHGPAILRASQ